MADKKTRVDLEILFSSGKIPTQSNFADLIASGVSQKDDGLQKASDTPLKIQAPVTVETDAKVPKDLILFYDNIEDDAAKWRIGIRSGGLEIGRGTQSDFIIDANGNVGIGTGTDTPGAKLHIIGSGLFRSSGSSEYGAVYLGDTNHGIKSTGGDGVTIFSYQVPAGIHLKQVSGYVGIGTTAPAGRLNITEDKGTIAGGSQGTIVIDHENSGGASSIVFRSKVNRSSDFGYIQYQDASAVDGSGESSRLIIGVENDADDHLILKPTGNVGIGTNEPKAKLHVIAPGGFGAENADGIATAGNVPIVAQSNSTAIGIINGSSRPAFALNVDGDGGTNVTRGVPTFFDRYDGNWHSSISLKNGNVGIGTTADTGVALEIIQNKAIRLGNANISSGGDHAHFANHTWYNGSAWQNDGKVGALYQITGQVHNWYRHDGKGVFTSEMMIDSVGNVGIGTAPAGRLNISEATGTAAGGSQGTIIIDHENNGGASSIVFRSKYNRSSDFGYIQYQDASTVGGGGESARFIIGIENDGDDHLILKATGNVGINTMNPRAALEVNKWVSVPLNASPDGFGPNTGMRSFGEGGQNFDLSILAEAWVGAAGFVANSDRRIKEIVGLSDTAKDLEIIQKMRVTDYRPLDKMAEGNSLRRGFIAQEVLEVFPQAVGERTNVIPDIYSNAASFVFDEKQKTLSVTMPEAHTLTEGEVVQILTEDGSKTTTVVEVPTTDSFVVDNFEKEPRHVFVHGRQVDDFLTVNYDQIFSTGIGAIQELNKIVASKSAEVKALQNQLETMRRKVFAQDERLAKLEIKESKKFASAS